MKDARPQVLLARDARKDIANQLQVARMLMLSTFSDLLRQRATAMVHKDRKTLNSTIRSLRRKCAMNKDLIELLREDSRIIVLR